MDRDKNSVRLASFDDIRMLNSLVGSCGGVPLMKAMFGPYNIPSLMENSVLSVICHKATINDSILGFLSVSDEISQNVDVKFEELLEVIRSTNPNNEDIQTINSLFVNFFCVDERKQATITSAELLASAFKENHLLENLFWLFPVNSILPEFAAKYFIDKDVPHKAMAGYRLLSLTRKSIMPKLYVREARIEDNDDIVPILKSQNDDTNISDYFLADLLTNSDDRTNFFVGIQGNKALAFLSVSLDINFPLISSLFDLGQFSIVKRSGRAFLKLAVLCNVDDIPFLSTVAASLKMVVLLVKRRNDDSIQFVMNTQNVERTMCVSDFSLYLDTVVESSSTAVDGVLIIVNDVELSSSQLDDVNKWNIGYLIITTSSTIRNADSGFISRSLNLSADLDERSRQYVDTISSFKKHCMSNVHEAKDDDINAFGVTSFCLDPSIEYQGNVLMRIAFEEMPTVDYGLYLIPCTSKVPINNFMTRVPLLSGVSYDKSLFIFHRNSLFASFQNIRLERVFEQNVQQVETYLQHHVRDYSQRDIILKSVDECMSSNMTDTRDNPEEVCFVCKIDSEIISVINLSRVLTSIEEVIWMRTRYDVDKVVDIDRHRNRAQCMVRGWHVVPEYSNWGKFILREVMRIYDKTLLYYKSLSRCPQQVLNEMIPITFRRQIETSDPFQSNEQPSSSIESYDSIDNRSLYITSKYHLQRIKSKQYTRIVIAGGSSATFALIEAFCMKEYLYPVNITVLLEYIPSYLESDSSNMNNNPGSKTDSFDMLSMDEMSNYTPQDLQLLGLKDKVTFIRERITDIDRENRSVILSNESVVEYDVLLLSPCSQDCSIRLFPSTKGTHPISAMRKGVFGLGNATVDTMALKWIEANPVYHQSVIVYGIGLNVFNAVSKLLALGLTSSSITIVTNQSFIADFNHPALNKKVEELVDKACIKVVYDHIITDVLFGENQVITNVRLADCAPKQQANAANDLLPCDTLLCCMETFVDFDLHAAINESGLVYDGGIVVDENFRTVDPRIYAVSSNTKFSRIYREALLHDRYNMKELGFFASEKIIDLFVDAHHNKSHVLSQQSKAKSIPTFNEPKSVSCNIPGGYKYFCTQTPALYAEKSDFLTEDNGEISMLTVSHLGKVLGFTFLGKLDIETRNLPCLINAHESLLNGAVTAFKQGDVNNWVNYFRQDWARILYHDKFSNLTRLLRNLLRNDKGVLEILEKVFELADSSPDDDNVAMARVNIFGAQFENLSDITRKTIESHVIEFLREHKTSLPWYHVPNSYK